MAAGKGFEKYRIPITWVFAIAAGVLLLFSDSRWEENNPLISALIFLVGCILVAIASLGRLWCTLYISGYKTKKLVTEGPYSMCRNPLYFFSFLGAAGVGCATETFTLPMIVVIVFALYYPFVIKSEEKDLLKRHGTAFASYLKSTPAFFPRYSLLKEPQQYLVEPKIFRKHIFDALWFVWLVGILELLESFHELNILPLWFKFY
jgi:protein-S-isoprenylcysteine O-methyltransferase Ste14